MDNSNMNTAGVNNGGGIARILPVVGLLCVTAATVWLSSSQTFEAMDKAKKAPPSVEEYRQQVLDRQAELNALTEEAQKSTKAVASLRVKDARQAIRKKDYPRAISLADEIIGVDPANAGAYLVRGIANYSTGQTDAALVDLSKAISLDARDAEAYLYRGLAYNRKKDSSAAVADFSQALKLNPQYGVAYYYRGLVRQQLRENEPAQADFRKARDLGVKQAAEKIKP